MKIGKPVDPFCGYGSEAEFRKAVDRELNEHDSHSAGADRSGSPQQRQFKLRGKPGSTERLKQAREYLGNDALMQTALVEQLGSRMESLVRSYAEGRNGRDRVVSELVRLTEGCEPQYIPYVAEMVSNTLAEVDWNAAQSYGDALVEADAARVEREHADWVNTENARMEKRERMMKDEARRAARKHSRNNAEYAMSILQNIDPEALYDDDLISDDEIKVAMRTAADASETARRAQSTAKFLEGFDEAVASGIGAPGSSWNDEQRGQWNYDNLTASAAIVAAKLEPPQDIEARAIASVEADRRGQSDWFDAFDAEAARLSGLTEHRERLADQAVANAKKHEEQLREWGLR